MCVHRIECIVLPDENFIVQKSLHSEITSGTCYTQETLGVDSRQDG
jgi:hypothetical protein